MRPRSLFSSVEIPKPIPMLLTKMLSTLCPPVPRKETPTEEPMTVPKITPLASSAPAPIRCTPSPVPDIT